MSSMPHITSAPLTLPMTFPTPASRPCEWTEPERTPPAPTSGPATTKESA